MMRVPVFALLWKVQVVVSPDTTPIASLVPLSHSTLSNSQPSGISVSEI